ncbi:MAG: RuvX/YqgF family protein [bacterium]
MSDSIPSPSTNLSGTILAVDVGLKRCGLAISDPQRRVAVGAGSLTIKDFKELAEKITYEAQRRQVTTLLISKPQPFSPSSRELSIKIESLAQALRKQTFLVILWNEAFTTAQALRERKFYGGRGKSQKKWVDEAAAVLLLQNYLDRIPRTNP